MPNNREWAMLAWLCVFVIWMLCLRTTRASMREVLRVASTVQILVPLSLLLAWVALELWVGYRLGIWRSDLVTDIVIWVSVSAIAALFKLHDVSKRPHFFRRRIIEILGVTEFLQFFTNLFVFNLAAELVLIPTLTLIGSAAAYTARKDQHRDAKKLLDWTLVVVGFVLVAFVTTNILVSWSQMDWWALARKLALPVWLTVGLLPFIYMLSIYANYERAFKGVNRATSDRRARWRAKVSLVAVLHGRSRDVHAFTLAWAQRLVAATDFAAARSVVGEFQRSRRGAEHLIAEERSRLKRYAGSNECDARGHRLDRREFKETVGALDWLATCQMGWYRNDDREDKYRPDLLELAGSTFARKGLPPDHGITMQVSDDGQRWYAWRRTVTGWCFAIGAAGPPPDQWTYDGPAPPNDFPGNPGYWVSSDNLGHVSRNWLPE